MSDTFRSPMTRRDTPRLDELHGYLVAIEPFRFEQVRSPFGDHSNIERMRCRITVAAPPRGQCHMAVSVDDRDHVLPVAFGTPERPIFTSSRGILAACHADQDRGRPATIGRLYLMGPVASDAFARKWWTVEPATSAELLIAEVALASLDLRP